jgi:hypothetical protein
MVVKTPFNWLTWLVFFAVSSLLIPNAYAGNVLSAGVNHVCGIKDDSTLICWGNNDYNQAAPPEGTFTQVSAGMNFNCALKTDGSLACWGRDTAGETSPPPGQFIQVESGGKHACALANKGVPICWGSNSSSQVAYPPGPYQQLALGDQHSCGLKIDSTVECWGNDSYGQSNIAADTFTSIVAGYKTTCGVKTDGVAICWGRTENEYGFLTQIDFGLNGPSNRGNPILCGLKSDSTLSCPSMDSVPSGVFSYVTVGGHNQVYCDDYDYWGDCNRGHHEFDNFGCGIRENGIVACWGYNNKGRATPPVGIIMKGATTLPPLGGNGEVIPRNPNPEIIGNGLSFSPLKPLYNIAETIEIDLVESLQVNRFERVDLWVVIQMPNGSLLYRTPIPADFLSLSPQPFKESLDTSEKTTRILEFEVIPGLGGEYTVYAAYVEEGKNPMTDSFLVLKSNIASVKVVLSNE